MRPLIYRSYRRRGRQEVTRISDEEHKTSDFGEVGPLRNRAPATARPRGELRAPHHPDDRLTHRSAVPPPRRAGAARTPPTRRSPEGKGGHRPAPPPLTARLPGRVPRGAPRPATVPPFGQAGAAVAVRERAACVRQAVMQRWRLFPVVVVALLGVLVTAQGSQGAIAGIVSAVVATVIGAVSSFIAYQKKKLCFKQSADEENVNMESHRGAQSEPPVQRTLLEN
ncbi:CD99 antigen [Pezoporus wallicus]|uniref:CD99 antigen n=1 Tax=Pezoporus wallicus TaxID=35540 RepID=UPI00254C6D11|nr:CD99 antigen [Pezoporus wallicus]